MEKLNVYTVLIIYHYFIDSNFHNFGLKITKITVFFIKNKLLFGEDNYLSNTMQNKFSPLTKAMKASKFFRVIYERSEEI